LLIPGSARGPHAGFGGLAEILEASRNVHSKEKSRDGGAAIVNTRAACAPENENCRDR
jgi:hypothetical protein